jgi:hypothetical protein
LFYQANFDFVPCGREATDPYPGSRTLALLRYRPPSIAKQSIAPAAKTEDYGFEVNKPHSVSININEGIRKLAAFKSLLGPIQLLYLLLGLAVQSISQELHIK